MNRIAIYVGQQLLEGNALLLPSIHDLLCEYIKQVITANNLELEACTSTLVTSRWVLSSLTATLQHHIACTCTVRKYGTLIYRPNTDLRPTLAKALWSVRNISRCGPLDSNSATPSNEAPEKCVEKCLAEVNAMVHSQIKALLAKNALSPVDHDCLNIEKIIQEMDPNLWKAVCILTQSATEKRGTSKTTECNSFAFHVKRIWRLFLMCTLMFITDDHCSIPLHILLADIVDSLGSSSILHRILNRVGMCASSDTLSRFMQHKEGSFKTTVDSFISNDSFTIVSADNVDFLHNFASIAGGKQQSSWHGTTIQAVQPLPSLTVLHVLSGCTEPDRLSLIPHQNGYPLSATGMGPSGVTGHTQPQNGSPLSATGMGPSGVTGHTHPQNGSPLSATGLGPSGVTGHTQPQDGSPLSATGMGPSGVTGHTHDILTRKRTKIFPMCIAS